MLDKLLSTAASNVKLVLAATAGAALVAGGSAVAISNVADSGTVAPSSAANEHISDQGLASRSDTATVGISPKPSHSPKADSEHGSSGNNHGACVSAIAKASPSPDASPGDHGKLVSAAAKSDCGKTAGATTADKAKGKSADAKNKTHATETADDATESEAPEAPEAPDSDSGTPNSNGTTHSNGHAGGH